MRSVEYGCARAYDTLAEDALGRHISERATVWHAEGRVRLGDGRAALKLLREERKRMSHLSGAQDHALNWAAQNVSQFMAALENCNFQCKLPGVGREARVRLLAREICVHSELLLSARRLLTVLETFESVEPMEAEELWALNAALKLEICTAFADVCAQVVHAGYARISAMEYADKLAGGAAMSALGDIRRAPEFYEKLAQMLETRGMEARLGELRAHMRALGLDLDETVRAAQTAGAQNALLIKNAKETLHTLDRIDWRKLTCALGSVHTWLMRDPAGIYPRMDFESQQLYIGAVSDIARRSGISQDAVARACVIAAGESVGLSRHVGWHLVDDAGRMHFIASLGADTPAMRMLARLRRDGKYLYIAANIAIALAWLCALCVLGMPWWMGVLGIAPALAFGQGAVNRLCNLLIKPRMLPRLDLSEGVPENLRTLVVIPGLLTSPERARELISQLETMAALEPGAGVDFLLLGDFSDSPRAQELDDADIADAARVSIARANARAGHTRFFYLQRRREFNDRHDRFMAHERKRGALMALNRLLLTGESEFEGDIPAELVGRYQFVMTLDADTRVPPGGIRRLVGTLAHPLNRAADIGGAMHGWAVLAPRMELSLAAVKNGFVRAMAGGGGFDAYQRGVSEAYWDASGEAVYAGKGIYDLRAFDGKLRGVLPDNAILSHDMLEGMIAGAGYVSDAPLYDGFPLKLGSYLKRLHRWTRGDWQLIRYLGRGVPGSGGEDRRNMLGAFDRWKVFANLFRSASAPVGLALLLAAMYMGNLPLMALGIAPLVMPVLISRWSRRGFVNMLYRIAIWPSEAACILDAICRTVYRVYASGRNMLEWVTSADAESQSKRRPMYPNLICAALCLPALLQPVSIVPALILGALFALAPLWTRRLEHMPEQEKLSRSDELYLRDVARDGWSFFTKNVSDTGLPPDNVQLDPPVGASMRTSPTNIGMYMASCVAAQELGFIDVREMLTRIGRTMRSLERMDKWRGHPYNWVDIQTLEPLRPKYVSTVDSGNLLGCLYLCMAELDSLMDSDLNKNAPIALPDPEVYERTKQLKVRISDFIADMDFKVLYDEVRNLFHIGVNTEQGALSRAYYDMLGSEARLASFAAIMKGDAPPKHFESLGRTCVRAGGHNALVSWSGTMFEYFMPHLLMDAPRGSLLYETLAGVLAEQIARDPDMPWGVSESGYYGFDAQLNYQYKAFGMPHLALSGGDAGVIAPYASELTAGFAPVKAVENLKRMQKMGFRGVQGFYEAVDCEPGRLPDGAKYRIVKSYMAHHKGMGLIGIANALTDNALMHLFMSRPEARALSIMLEERPARGASVMPEQPSVTQRPAPGGNWARRASADMCPPDVIMLTGPDASALLTADGGGYARRGGIDINRWRADAFNRRYGPRVWAEIDGNTIDMAKGAARFEPGAATWTRREPSANMELEMIMSPEDGALLARATVENASGQPLEVQVTGFCEIALSARADDEAHPGFRGLFVQSESPAPGALLFKRRRRDAGADEPLALAMICAPEDALLSCESNRREFMGRGGQEPRGLERQLNGDVGRILDPCAAVRARFTVPPHERRTVGLALCSPPDRTAAADMLEKYSDAESYSRAAELSRLRARTQLEFMGLTADESFAIMRVAAYLAFANAPRPETSHTQLDRKSLWQLGISGDLPILLVELDENAHYDTARNAIRYVYMLRHLGMECDLIIICAGEADYRRNALDELRAMANAHGGAHIIEGHTLHGELRTLIRAIAAVRFNGETPLDRQMMLLGDESAECEKTVWPEHAREYLPAKLPEISLNSFNGFGGFDAQGGYVIDIADMPTPAPWVNILANESFGMIVGEDGGGFIWHGSSREGGLTRWRGDVLNAGCEQVVYLRDEQTGTFASLTPAPCGALPIRVRHAPGETCFSGRAMDVDYELKLNCDDELPVIYMRVRLDSTKARRVSLTGFVDWVMGAHTSRLTRAYAQGGMALCEGDMPGVGWCAYVETDGEICLNLLEFLGTDGDRAHPGAMKRARLNPKNALQATSPCGAVRIYESLRPGETLERTFAIGWARSADEARQTLSSLRAWSPAIRARRSLENWRARLERLSFDTPDNALNVMLNQWLPYQTQVSRIWARAGYYQPGGAYGFRDQLQDMLALIDTDPAQVRAHILRCAAHQFEDGDVQHWWHEPYRGVRTHISDDMLFLPYVTALYAEHTGDYNILEETVPFLKNVSIPDGAEDIYTECEPSDDRGTLREHCLRAIRRADTRGIHGLPLMGAGDWNDGMNRVGAQGRGESVWLGMFMCEVLRVFAPLSGISDELMARRRDLLAALEKHGWDGQWYRRAYYDDGTPLGSAQGEECRIDVLSQAWAALAGLDSERVAGALDAAWELLVDRDAGIVRLLTPPFDEGSQQPGYIKGYLPGIRENGGQYTHAAVWLMMALIQTGQRRRAWRILEMLLPPNHSDSMESAERYVGEPYVLAADIYGAPPNEGRGGWTWYTGSAAWLVYAVRRYMLGFEVRADRLRFAPKVPEYWQEVGVSYAYGSARYEIKARRDCRKAQPAGIMKDGWIQLKDDGETHEIILPLK